MIAIETEAMHDDAGGERAPDGRGGRIGRMVQAGLGDPGRE
jgi:hypothetical protein